MAFSLHKNSERGVVGLDIDGRYRAAAQVDSGRFVCGASHELQVGLVRDGEVADRDGLADALKSFVNRAGLPRPARRGEPANRGPRGGAAAVVVPGAASRLLTVSGSRQRPTRLKLVITAPPAEGWLQCVPTRPMGSWMPQAWPSRNWSEG
jgi:hypothetical protein